MACRRVRKIELFWSGIVARLKKFFSKNKRDWDWDSILVVGSIENDFKIKWDSILIIADVKYDFLSLYLARNTRLPIVFAKDVSEAYKRRIVSLIKVNRLKVIVSSYEAYQKNGVIKTHVKRRFLKVKSSLDGMLSFNAKKDLASNVLSIPCLRLGHSLKLPKYSKEINGILKKEFGNTFWLTFDSSSNSYIAEHVLPYLKNAGLRLIWGGEFDRKFTNSDDALLERNPKPPEIVIYDAGKFKIDIPDLEDKLGILGQKSGDLGLLALALSKVLGICSPVNSAFWISLTCGFDVPQIVFEMPNEDVVETDCFRIIPRKGSIDNIYLLNGNPETLGDEQFLIDEINKILKRLYPCLPGVYTT